MGVVNLLAKIAKAYPFSQPEIYKNLIKTFPHQGSNFEVILVYQRVAFALCERLLRQCVKDSGVQVATSTSVASQFKSANKRQLPLR
jgi:hypothetical protein